MTLPGAQRRWRRRVRLRLLEQFGAYCGANAPLGVGCGANGSTPLQFAHLYPTGVSGMGRGDRRSRDVRTHALAYALLCASCHVAFDGRDDP